MWICIIMTQRRLQVYFVKSQCRQEVRSVTVYELELGQADNDVTVTTKTSKGRGRSTL